MATVAIRIAHPKMTMSAVQGKILVYAEDGERIGQWGGTECFLSRQSGLGPCLVVRSSKHKKHQGTFFKLSRLQRVLSTHVAEGKLTVVVPHEQRVCSVYIETTEDLDELRMMAGVLQDRSRWVDMEKNVASKTHKGARRVEGAGGVASLSTQGNEIGGGGGVDVGVGGEFSEDEFSEVDDNNNDATQRSTSHSYAAPGTATMNTTNTIVRTTISDVGENDSWSQKQGTAVPRASPAVVPSSPLFSSSMSSPPSSSSVEANFTTEQRRATQLLRSGRNVFISGAAGTGKTEWLLYVLEHVLHARDAARKGRVAVTAATGIAARLLDGQTVHAFAGIGRGEGEMDAIVHRVESRHDVVRAWQLCEVLVIDEVSMLSAHTFTLLDRVARVLRAPLPSPSGKKNNAALPFGGVQLLVVGDFLQLPPVSRGAGEEAQPAFSCPAWQTCNFTSVIFTKDYRHGGDDAFAQCCADVRRGQCTPLVQTVLQACLHRPLEERFGVSATTLMARRKDVDRYNAQRLQELDTVAFQRYASEDYATVPGTDIDSEVSLPAVLTLKEGAQVVLLATLPDTGTALSNGELGVVIGFVSQAHGPALPRVRFANGVEAVVPAITMEVFDRDGRLTLSRRQVPLQLAWALTVHRVQGMTLPMVRLALDNSFFESGQAYVALSRVRSAADLSLTAFQPAALERVSAAACAFYAAVAGSADVSSRGEKEVTRTEEGVVSFRQVAARKSTSPAAQGAEKLYDGRRRRPRSASPSATRWSESETDKDNSVALRRLEEYRTQE